MLSLSQWAAQYAYLSKETSAQTGRFEAYAYQVGMMDAITDPRVEKVSVMKSARVGYTKIIDHVVGYYLHQDPSPILVVQPRVEDAEDYSKSEIAPMLRDTTVLAEIAPDPKTRTGENTLLKKTMKNGASIALVGANSPGGFRRITVRIVLFDEVDGYPVGGAGSEGDQIALGTKRSETFWNRKIVSGSTPTIKGLSRIENFTKRAISDDLTCNVLIVESIKSLNGVAKLSILILPILGNIQRSRVLITSFACCSTQRALFRSHHSRAIDSNELLI